MNKIYQIENIKKIFFTGDKCVSQSLKGIFWQIRIIKFKCITTIKFSEINFCQKIPFINYITQIFKIHKRNKL